MLTRFTDIHTLLHHEAGGAVIDVDCVSLARDEVAARVDILLEVAVDPGADGIPGAPDGDSDVYLVAHHRILIKRCEITDLILYGVQLLMGGNTEMDNPANINDLLSRLFATQQLGVLSTDLEGQPYSNLVAFAATEDLKSLVFVTNRNTSKYANIISNPKVAMMIDSRTNKQSDFNSAVAVTILGTAVEVTGNERDRLLELYIAKHPHLADFVSRPYQALIRVTASDFIVARFDSVQVVHISE